MNQPVVDDLAGFAKFASAAASLRMLPKALGRDIYRSIAQGQRAGAVMQIQARPETIFKVAVAQAITALAPRHRLLIDFLVRGPYYDAGEIPDDKRTDHNTDAECALAIRFVFGHVVNAFKGRLAELLAIGPCVEMMADLGGDGVLPRGARLYVGDAVQVPGLTRDALRKGADMHVASIDGHRATIHAVVEVKSYVAAPGKVRDQLEHHVRRLRRGFVLDGLRVPPADVLVGQTIGSGAEFVWVVPASWRLSRQFEFKRAQSGSSVLEVDDTIPEGLNERSRDPNGGWRIKLRWSEEALAAAAFELSFWYMEKLGEHIYNYRPSPWPEMTPAEAGRNAAKQSLYYAILRVRGRDQQKAIALYNMYGFGYALGANFVDKEGRRDVLFPEDLREIAANGSTKNGGRIV